MFYKYGLLFILSLFLISCTSVPKGIEPVKNFKIDNYLGTWYEIARFDHSFEEGLNNVSAHYSLRDDGGVDVVNRGYNAQNKEWEEAKGKAYFVDDESLGHLKVSFFGPFYSSYVVFYLDHSNYQYALVSGPSRDYLWLLSRQKTLPQSVLKLLIREASAAGFDTSKLIFVEQD
ncbi:lipocalin family protein [Aliiglaciecola lipolytica]|uniref:Outer membrane lipoprotein Blc n=1 Tax=Aliiglaciecola lipolytica E3 TaxID=1127673 RepID=K6YAB1_9ALTE|nr:lipocalin family protein [Aliiglaciecola lipolytica]GAC13603.1 outer membrane lipoprotein Blc [Aliiglaciecola lipolytica E3]